jgi:drug/metabolite transporter (DMT)-like permease
MKLSRGVWLMLLASLSFGLMNVSVKFVHNMPVSQVVFFRALVQIVLSAAVLWQLKISPLGKNPKLLMLRGLFGAAGDATGQCHRDTLPISHTHYTSGCCFGR